MLLSGGKKGRGRFDDYWIEVGRKSFARFFCMSLKDLEVMEKNQNEIFFDMMDEILSSLSEFENYMVKTKQLDDIIEGVGREDLIDI